MKQRTTRAWSCTILPHFVQWKLTPAVHLKLDKPNTVCLCLRKKKTSKNNQTLRVLCSYQTRQCMWYRFLKKLLKVYTVYFSWIPKVITKKFTFNIYKSAMCPAYDQTLPHPSAKAYHHNLFMIPTFLRDVLYLWNEFQWKFLEGSIHQPRAFCFLSSSLLSLLYELPLAYGVQYTITEC